MDERILDCLRTFGPSIASEIAARLSAPEAHVDRRLRMMFGTRVTTLDGTWRLIDAAPLPYLAVSTESLALAFRLGGA